MVPVSTVKRPRWIAAPVAASMLCGCGAPPSPVPVVPAAVVFTPPPSAPAPPAARAPVLASTGKMVRLLAELAAASDPADNPLINARRVTGLRSMLGGARSPEESMALRIKLCEELLNAGDPEAALVELDVFLDAAAAPRPGVPAEVAKMARQMRALAWIRVGEQTNCVKHHDIQSCIAPIEGGGIHRDKRGSREAMALLLTMQDESEQDLMPRWMLNIVAMTLGKWPSGLPKNLVIPPTAFASDYDIRRFRDVSAEAGVQNMGLSGGVITEDFDGDGDLDVLYSHIGITEPLSYHRNDGDGTFSVRTTEAGLDGLNSGLNMVDADYDNDGDVDVLVLRGAWLKRAGGLPNSLLRNRGDGTFEDVTEGAGMLTFHPTQNAAWGDYDNDGWLDVFVGNESEPDNPHPSELWHNNRDGTFSNRIGDLPLGDLNYIKGSAWGDMNNDGRLDLYVSVLRGPNFLFRNDGERQASDPRGAGWKFTDVTREAGVAQPITSFPTWWFDYDNDGWQDLFVGGYYVRGMHDVAAMYLGQRPAAGLPRLYRNQRDGTFLDVTVPARLDRILLAMAGNFGDLDNDGWLDFYIGTGEPSLAALMPNRMFRNADGVSFQDVTTSGGFGHLQKGHAIAFADMDGDGDQDVVAGMGGAFEADVARNSLYENPGHGNHWVTLRLEGRKTNRSAIGARLRVRAGGRDRHVTVGTGGSFGAASLAQEIGLGQATQIEELVIDWPTTGQQQVFRDLAVDRVYRVVEGGTPEPVAVKPVRLGGAKQAKTPSP